MRVEEDQILLIYLHTINLSKFQAALDCNLIVYKVGHNLLVPKPQIVYLCNLFEILTMCW